MLHRLGVRLLVRAMSDIIICTYEVICKNHKLLNKSKFKICLNRSFEEILKQMYFGIEI